MNATDVTNKALAQIGTRSQITGFGDGSAESLYAGLLYYPLRDFMLREGDYEFAMYDTPAVPTFPVFPPWLFAYQIPPSTIRIRTLIPANANPLDPYPVEWTTLVIGTDRRIVTRAPADRIIYTAPVLEDFWDSMFLEAFVRMLASELAFALENRIDASKVKLDEGISFAGMANLRDG